MAITMVAAGRVYGVGWSVRDGAFIFAAFLLVLAAHYCAARSDLARKWAGVLLVTVVFGFSLANSVLLLYPRQEYGDAVQFVSVVESGVPFSRWMAGTAILGWLHAALWKFPPLAALLPNPLQTSHGFVLLLSSLCMYVAAIALLCRRGAPFAGYVTVTSVMWLTFSLGYVEYYPFIAGLMVCALVWLLGRSWDQHEPRTLGLLLGAVASLYIGFWPIAGIVAAVFTLANPKRNYSCAAWAGLAYLCCVRFFWPKNPTDFFASLWYDMNFGELNNSHYAGLSSGSTSIYFKTAHVFTLSHLRDIGYLSFFSGTLAALSILTAVTGVWVLRAPRRLVRALLTPAGLAAALIFAYYARYFLWKIPKLGLRNDLDLYFMPYLLVPFFVGLAIDKLDARMSLTGAHRFAILAFLAGNMVPLCYIITCKGVPTL